MTKELILWLVSVLIGILATLLACAVGLIVVLAFGYSLLMLAEVLPKFDYAKIVTAIPFGWCAGLVAWTAHDWLVEKFVEKGAYFE